MSDTKTLYEALLAFQAEAPTLQKDAVNPHFRNKYVSLDSITQTIVPLLCKHGLLWITLPSREDGEPSLRYQLVHAASGEKLEGSMPLMITKGDPQGQGSGLTYARRYAVSAVLGLSAEDDDGNSASQRRHNGQARQPSAPPAQATERPMSAKQRSLVFAKAGEENMPASILANVVLVSSGSEAREFESEEQAEAWLRRAMDRVPARLVDPILANIKAEAVGS